ncbi:MAG: PKD domain-containing protein [Saprospiraceae bacterium]
MKRTSSILSFILTAFFAGSLSGQIDAIEKQFHLSHNSEIQVKANANLVKPVFYKPIIALSSNVKSGNALENESVNSSNIPSSPEVRTSFEGNLGSSTGSTDNSMAISDSGWIVSTVNSTISYYDENGGVALQSESLNDFFAFLNLSESIWQTRVSFDPEERKFVMVNLSGTSKDSSHLIVSFSFSEDPGDGWWVYSFDDVADRSDAWFDKVDFSITDNELMVSGILRDTNNVFSESVVLLFDKYVGYMGQNLNYCFVWDFINEPGEEIWGVSPIQYEETGIASRWMIASSLAGGDTIKLIEFTGDCGTPDFDVFTYSFAVSTYQPGSNAAQPGSGTLLSVGDCQVQDAFMFNDTVYYVHHDKLNDGSNCIRLGQLSVSGSVNSFQKIGVANTTYAYPSIIPFTFEGSSISSLVIGFCRSNASTYPEFSVLSVDKDYLSSLPITVREGESANTLPIGNPKTWAGFTSVCRKRNDLPSCWAFGPFGINSTLGNWIAEIVPLGSGPNYPCESATQIFCGESYSGNTIGNPQETPDCFGSYNSAGGNWFRLFGTGGEVMLSTCNASTDFDTKIAVYTGSCSNLICIAGSDEGGCVPNANKAQLSIYAIDGEEYFIYITGSGAEAGNYELNVSCVPDQPTCNGGFTLTDCSGTISDGSGFDNYSNELSCSWTISPIDACEISLNFTEFETELNFDKLRVFDGVDTFGVLLGVFSGNNLPSTLIGTSGHLFILFETDGSFTSAGWSANYTCDNSKPIADFSANPVIGDAPLAVDFINLSQNTTSVHWNFPGAIPSTSTELSPSNIVFGLPGTYTVVLTATKGACTSTKSIEVTVNQTTLPLASFMPSTTCGIAPLSVDFANNSVNAASYIWSFQGGVPAGSTEISPSNVVFNSSGLYSVSLIAIGSGGERDTQSLTIIVDSGPTVAGFTANPISGLAPLSVNFTNESENANSFTWSFQGATPNNSTDSDPQNIVYTNPGIYTVELTAFGNCSSATHTTTINVVDEAVPIANFTTSTTCVRVGKDTVRFSDQSQNFPDSWSWFFPGGIPGVSSEPNPEVVYSTSGEYDVTLIVSNAAGIDTILATAFVSVVDVQVVGDDQICLGESVFLTATGATNFFWQGPPELSGNNGSVVSVKPTASGTAIYTIVGNTGNCSDDPVSFEITVKPVPILNVSISQNEICLGQGATLTADGADTYVWTGPGLSTNTGSEVTANPVSPGNYTYSVIGSIDGCDSELKTINLLVKAVPNINLLISPANICLGSPVSLTASGISGQYTWSGPGLPSNPTGSMVTAVPPKSGAITYTVTGTGANGCTSQASAQVNVSVGPEAMVTDNPNLICLGDTAILTASGAFSYQWVGPFLLTETGSMVTIITDMAGDFTYEVTGSSQTGCAGNPVELEISVVDNPLSATISLSGCPGPTLTFNALVTNGGSTNNITWYLNGAAVWAGPNYQLFNALNGSKVYCTVEPQNPMMCTHPLLAYSDTIIVDCAVPTFEIDRKEAFAIFPNPANGLLYISLKSTFEPNAQIQVFDGIGKLVLDLPIQDIANDANFSLDISELSNGIYWLSISDNSHRRVAPFQKK